VERANYNIVALDLGSSNITVAVGRINNEGKLQIVDITTGAMQGFERGNLFNRQEALVPIKEAISKVQDKLGIQITDIYIGASGKDIKCANHDYYVHVSNGQDGEISKTDVAKLHDMMNNIQSGDEITIIERIPLGYVVDGRRSTKAPVGEFGRTLSSTFNFVLDSSYNLKIINNTLRNVGISIRRTIPSALASAEAVLLPEERERGVAVVDLGAGTADLSIWYEGTARFVRGIPLGAADINSDIHQQGIFEMCVESLKKQHGVAMIDMVEEDCMIEMEGRSRRERQEISKKNLAIIIENRVREIIGFIKAEIEDSGYKDKLHAGIVLVGGGSQLEGIDALFSRETGMDIRLALPDVNIAEESRLLAQDPAYATAIGLLLKATQQARESFKPIVAPPEPPEPPKPSKPDSKPDDDKEKKRKEKERKRIEKEEKEKAKKDKSKGENSGGVSRFKNFLKTIIPSSDDDQTLDNEEI
jgi:cell division protein FtsA